MVRGAKGAAVGAAGLVAVAIFAVSTSSSAAGAASDLLKASASTLYGAFGGEPTDLASLYRIEAGCEESRRALQSKQGAPWQKGGVGGAEMTAAVATAAPTLTEYWTVLWTEGTSELSYVWVMDHQDAGISAYVLVDTTGKAQGVTLSSNDTTVNFVAENGAVYKADISGFDVTEILDYCDSSNIGTDGSSDCAGMGLDYWDYTGQLYFVDANLGYLMACDYDGGSAEILVKGIPDPYGVAVDKKTGLVIFTGEGAIYATHYESTELTITEVTTFLSPSYYVTGVAVDSENGYVYWTGDDKVYRDTVSNTQIETVYGNVPGAKSVSVDWEQDLLFYTDDYGVHLGNLDGSSDAETIAYLYNTTFVYIHYETTPTPAPTSLPTSSPTFAPSDKPSQAPTGLPSTQPSFAPTSYPTPSPTGLPTSEPTFVPTCDASVLWR